MPENIMNKYSANFANSNVLFKQGTQSALNSLITNGGASEGAFYLTNDTHRMYVGRTRTFDNKIVPVPVNEGITTVADLDALNAVTDANVGDFYFVTAGNILAVCYKVETDDGTRKCRFSQLNINTDHNNRIDQAQFKLSVPTGETNQANIEYIVTDDDNKEVSDNFTVIGGENVNVTVNTASKTITIAADDTTYELTVATTSTNGATVTLDASEGNDSQVTFVGVDNGNNKGKVVVTGTAKNGNTPASINIKGPEIDGLSGYYLGQGTPVALPTSAPTAGFDIALSVDGVENSHAYVDPTVTVGADTGLLVFIILMVMLLYQYILKIRLIRQLVMQ